MEEEEEVEEDDSDEREDKEEEGGGSIDGGGVKEDRVEEEPLGWLPVFSSSRRSITSGADLLEGEA